MNMQMETGCIFISHQVEKKKAHNITDVVIGGGVGAKRNKSTLVTGS